MYYLKKLRQKVRSLFHQYVIDSIEAKLRGSVDRIMSGRDAHYAEMIQTALNNVVDITKVPPARGGLRAVQLANLQLLRVVSAFLDDHQIPYFLAYGTLLGAERHGGFVPWDDDIDIIVPEEKMESLKKLLEDATAGTDFVLYGIERTRWADATFRIGHKRSELINIDVFGAFPMRLTREEFLTQKEKVAEDKKYYFSEYELISKTENRATISEFNCKTVARFRKTLSGCAIDEARAIYPLATLYATYHEKDTILPLRKIAFEGYEFSAPNRVDKCLEDLYGDWMSFPRSFEHHGDRYKSANVKVLEDLAGFFSRCAELRAFKI